MSVESKVAEIDKKLEEAKANIEAVDLGDLLLEKAKLYHTNGMVERATEVYKEVIAQSISTNIKMEGIFGILLIAIKGKDNETMDEYLKICQEKLDQGGDWEKRNKMKIYEGLYLITKRDFERSSKLLMEALLTFTSTELFDYKQYVFYTVLTNMVTLDRVNLKKKVVDNSDVASCINETPHLQEFLESFYYGRYKEFMHHFLAIIDLIKTDFYFHAHYKYFVKEMRIKVYNQFLKSYKSITIGSMADQLGVTEDFVDRELSKFISEGRLSAKIDKVNGVIECIETEESAELYQRTIKESDILLNKIHKLSKLLEI